MAEIIALGAADVLSSQEEPVAPHLLQGVDPDTHAPSMASARTQTPHEKRRRGWHKVEIKSNREKKRLNEISLLAAESSRAESPLSPAVKESHPSPPAQGRRCHPLYERTEGQWRDIENLRLCASCLTRTTPPHGPGDSHAPCLGQPHAAFNTAKVSMIRKALEELEAEHRPSGETPQPSRQWHPGNDEAGQGQSQLRYRSSYAQPRLRSGMSTRVCNTLTYREDIYISANVGFSTQKSHLYMVCGNLTQMTPNTSMIHQIPNRSWECAHLRR
jgi:hypothetical protein